MKLFAVLFEDDWQNAAVIRKEYQERHFAFLEENAASIRTAGPLSREGDAFAGGLWLVEAVNADEVDRLVKEDPFWSAGLRKSVQILTWSQVFADGSRRI
ncbi:YciI family protein [Rhizobium calliandrae]|uniref:YciI family protein n=1 Tax=Rhizobium calliandrae TaxID=1312182 RepID=A0ABT7KM90_9HYPH|nr:YciI family protein [Rhizobium calliandrae]MDL2408364.1 YciI family protein [Rhizobium calliandrae]